MKKVKIWIFQNNLSGNANGHFDILELPVTSTKKDVIESQKAYFYKIWNIKCLGIFSSGIGDRSFPTNAFLNKIKHEY